MILSSNLPKKRGRPLGSRDKRARKVAKKVGSKSKAFKQVDKNLRSMPNIPPIPVRILKDEMVKDQEIKILNLEPKYLKQKVYFAGLLLPDYFDFLHSHS
jgi:hypothetical protein